MCNNWNFKINFDSRKPKRNSTPAPYLQRWVWVILEMNLTKVDQLLVFLDLVLGLVLRLWLALVQNLGLQLVQN